MKKKIAILMTCFNRKDNTLDCLTSLFAQKNENHFIFQVFLVDDGSTDGTGDAVRNQFPKVHIIQGDGNLYWCGGMRLAWKQAMQDDYDYYLWLNDDTILLPHALKILLDTTLNIKKQDGYEGIVIGSCCDPKTRQHTYGGRIMTNFFLQFPYIPMLPDDNKTKRCDTMNGNLVLVPRKVFKLLGNFSPEYTHAFGDTDYGMRATQLGIKLDVTPGYLAECAPNTKKRPWMDVNVPLAERWYNMCSPLGLPPKQWYVYTRRNSGILWPLNFIKPFVRLLFPQCWHQTK